MVLTIGHSTRPLTEFVAMLQACGVRTVADVRRFPASRRYPHFNRDALDAELARAEIGYVWVPELGGRRRARADSRNTRWRNVAFRGYADYMETPPFREAAARLQEIAAAGTTAVMCAEAQWWRCHRSLIADYLTARGVPVAHIIDARRVEPDRYTEPARVVDGELSYAEERLI